MDPLAYTIFSGISAMIRVIFFTKMDKAYINMVDAIGLIAVSIETIVIMRYGFVILSRQTSEDERNPDVQELLYHLLVVCGVLALLKSGTAPLDFIMGLRTMLISGFTGIEDRPGGQQMESSLNLLNAAIAVGNIASSINSTYVNSLKSSLLTMALTFTVSPQITGALLLLFNEVMTRFGMALFPLAAYAALYKTTRDVFTTWVGLMLSLGVLMAVSAVTVAIMVDVTLAFSGIFSANSLASAFISNGTVGKFVLSEIQQAIIQSGFGFTLTIIILNFPVNAANFVGGYIIFAGPSLNNELGALYKNDRRVKMR
jgi:TrbL/VirB6 plasmid conjugal transfer protein